MVITLIGYRGSGKSSVAEPLAVRLGWQARDADREIERRAGKSIAAIFADEGEPHFRALEREVMAELLDETELVIAAGGGCVLCEETRRAMGASGPVVWLKADVDVLADRIGADESTWSRRPDLTAEGGRREIERLLAAREPLYRDCASLSVETAGRSVDDVVEFILAWLRPSATEDR